MESFEEVKKNIYNYINKYKFTEISNIDNQSNLQIIFANDEIKLEFLRDRGEFDIYIEFLDIKTEKDIYSIVILAQILSAKDFSESESKEIINYLNVNIDYIKKSFINNKQLERDYDIAFNNSLWE